MRIGFARIGLLAAAVLLVAVGATSYLASRSRHRLRQAAPPASSPAVEDGATLALMTLAPPTPSADAIFASGLMSFSVALDKADRHPRLDGRGDEGLARAEAALVAPEVRHELGAGPFAAMSDMVSVAKRASRAPPADDASVAELDLAVARLDNSLLAARLPYFVDATVMMDPRRVGRERLIIFSEFSIVESNLYESGDARVRSVRVRRLDRLNWKHASLGFVNPRRAQAAVLLDQVDEQLVRHLLPALAEGAAMPLVPHDETRGRTGTVPTSAAILTLGTLAGTHARDELGGLPGAPRDAVRELGEALQERRALFEKWGAQRRALGIGIRVPSALSIDLDAFERDQEAFDPNDLDALRRIQGRLGTPEASRTYAALRDAFADSIERHEVQHRLDLKHTLPMPRRVADLFRGESAAADDQRSAVQNELSGYLAQIGRDERMSRTTLTLLLRFLVNPRTRRSTEGHVAAVAAEELAAELGIAGVAPLLAVGGGGLDEARLARAHRELTGRPSAELARAAVRVWARLFERELAPLVRLEAPPPGGS